MSMSMTYERVIPLDGTFNVRDLGGYALSNGGETRWRRLLRADGLHRMTDDSMAEMVDLGVRTIIDLRGEHELTPDPNPFAAREDVRYHNIPLYDELAPVTAHDGFDMGQRYMRALDICGPRIAEVLRTIAAADADGGVLYHCTAGKDRTGIISALILTLVGVPRAMVVADYAMTADVARDLLSNLRSTAISRGLDARHVDRVLASNANSMEMMLDYLDRQHDGIAAYVERIGIDAETVSALERRLTV